MITKIVWLERIVPYGVCFAISPLINLVTGIAKLKFSNRILTFVALTIISETMVRIKKSDKIFYSIPKLPSKSLEE